MFKRILPFIILTGLIINNIHSINIFKLHEYFVSIAEIEYNDDSHKFEITIKFTTHDIEKAISSDLNLDDTSSLKQNQHELMNYIQSHFDIKSNSNYVKLNLLGYVSKLDETLLVFIESDEVINIDNLEISNSLLIETFDHQENIAHLKLNSSNQTLIFNKNKTTSLLEIKN